MRFRRGLYGSFMMEPLGAWGFHFAYRSNDYLRFTGGLGVISPGYSKDGLVVTGGPKWMIPGWNFTPVIGTNLQFTVSTTQPFELAIFENIGVEYTSLRGFHIGIGLGVAYLSTQGTQYLGRAMPYFNMGYFF